MILNVGTKPGHKLMVFNRRLDFWGDLLRRTAVSAARSHMTDTPEESRINLELEGR